MKSPFVMLLAILNCSDKFKHVLKFETGTYMLILPIIQARSNSSRLPGKITKSFSNNYNALDYIIYTLRSLSLDPILATTINKADDLMVLQYQEKARIFRGSENDVLSRFTSIIEKYHPRYVLRICADNPFLLKDGIAFLIEQACNNPDISYLSFSMWGKPAMKVSLGIFAELVKSDALLLRGTSLDPLDREHVTINLYSENASNFTLFPFEKFFYSIPQDIRLTMDTPEDFQYINQIITDLKLDPPCDKKKFLEVIEYIIKNQMLEKMRAENMKTINSKNYTPDKK